jgi:hypothetical protein
MRTDPAAGFRARFVHEVNYPVGPLVVLLALVPWRRARALGVGLGISLAAIVIFSMDLAPFSRALLAAIPPLHSFRVPSRSALVWLWLVPILGAAALAHRDRIAPRAWAAWLAIPLAMLLLILPPIVRECAAVLLVAVVVVLTLLRRQAVPVAIVLVVLGVSSVAAFGERLSPFLGVPSLFATAEAIGTAVRTEKPALESSLARVRLDFEVPPFAPNTAVAARLSSLDGYAVPTRRFSALVVALRGERYEPTANFFRLTAADTAFPALRQLYNVTDSVAVVPPQRLAITALGPTAGPAWFSVSVSRADDLTALARELRESGDTLHLRVRQVLWHDGADPLAASAPLPSQLDDRCRDARVAAVHAPRRSSHIVAEVATAAACPLTFATNFTEDLRAMAVLAGGVELAVPVFPAYGALAGVWVPAGATMIRLRAQPVQLPWAGAWVALGIACCAGAAWLTRGTPVATTAS